MSHVTSLLIKHYHEQTGHQGKGMTLAKLRSAGYWIVGANRRIASHVYKCVSCRKIRGAPQTQQMASLPTDRVDEAPPFSYCGCDCFGPFTTKDGRKENKRYGLIFTCMSSRAIHLELLNDMTTDSFINGLRCLIAIRGPVRQLRCDRGTNFVGAMSELTNELLKHQPKLESSSKSMKIEFVFNPPHASHMGGVWERQIRTVRNVLKGLLLKHGARFDTSSLRTILYEVMAIVNSRPLGPVTEENIPLTPNALLTMKSEIALPPPGEFSESDVYARKRWRQVQYIANEFWHRWRTEYLSTLQQRQKWVTKTRNINVGDIVLVNESDTVRNEWKLAKVTECNKSADDLVRSVKLLLANPDYPKNSKKLTYLVKPLTKIVVLLEATPNSKVKS